MSHFSVLVVTSEYPHQKVLEQALLPYHEYECTGIEAYLQFVPLDEDELKQDHEKYGEGRALDVFVKEYYGDHYYQEDGKWGRKTNPNKEWDWWVVGGRYANRLCVKGHSGKFDQAQKGALDLDTMARERYQGRVETWEEYEKDKARKAPALEFIYGIKEGTTREDYLSADTGFMTFAVLVDGQWHERGDMGWWGVVHDEKDDWPTQFKALFESISDEAWLTIVDCHI